MSPSVRDILAHPEDYDPQLVEVARWLHSPDGEDAIEESNQQARANGIEPYPVGHPKRVER